MKNLLFSTLSVFLLFVACSKEEQAPPPPPTPTYTLSFSAEAGGSVSSEGGTYTQGSKITVTATPDAQYLFKEWSDGSTTNPREITVTSNLTLKASFIKKTYPLAVTIEGEGTVQEEVIIQGSTSETEYNAGTTVRLTAIPNEGWVFAGWSGDVESDALEIEVPIEKGTAVSALFKKGISLTINFQGDGTLILNEQLNIRNDTLIYIESDRAHDFSFIPDEDWYFSQYRNEISVQDNPSTIFFNEEEEVLVIIFVRKNGISLETETFILEEFLLDVTSTITSDPSDFVHSLGSSTAQYGFVDSNGKENLILPSGNSQTVENQVTYHLIKTENLWSIVNEYPEPNFGNARDYDRIEGQNSIAFADHGEEWQDGRQWEFGHTFYIPDVNTGSWDWIQLSDNKSFYHSVAIGDIDKNGLNDVASSHFGTYSDFDWGRSNVHMWFQTSPLQFEKRPFIFQPDDIDASAIEISDIDGDGNQEFIVGIPDEGIAIYEYEDQVFKKTFTTSEGIFSKEVGVNISPTTIETQDINGDGFMDLIVICEGWNNIQVWNGNNNGTIDPGQIVTEGYDIASREFELIDVDNDGDLDITLNPIALWESKGLVYEEEYLQTEAYVDISKLIYFNNNGLFAMSSTPIMVPFTNIGGVPRIKGMVGKAGFKFFTIQTLEKSEKSGVPRDNMVKIVEISPKFYNW